MRQVLQAHCIGGVRTALYNYLFARQQQGTFILRIEDTDQMRYVPGAETIHHQFSPMVWTSPDEGPGFGGAYGPYRQSERKEIYDQYAMKLVHEGKAYYAFDTPDELENIESQIPPSSMMLPIE